MEIHVNTSTASKIYFYTHMYLSWSY